MKRRSLFFTDPQLSALQAYAQRYGLKFAELLRRIVDDWIQRLPPEAPPMKEEER